MVCFNIFSQKQYMLMKNILEKYKEETENQK